MPRYEHRDKDGALLETLIVTEETLKADPDAVIRQIGPKGTRPGTAEGYEYIATMKGDPDGLRTDVTVHVFAKKSSFEKEKPSKLAGLRAVVAEIEAKAEEAPAK